MVKTVFILVFKKEIGKEMRKRFVRIKAKVIFKENAIKKRTKGELNVKRSSMFCLFIKDASHQ